MKTRIGIIFAGALAFATLSGHGEALARPGHGWHGGGGGHWHHGGGHGWHGGGWHGGGWHGGGWHGGWSRLTSGGRGPMAGMARAVSSHPTPSSSVRALATVSRQAARCAAA